MSGRARSSSSSTPAAGLGRDSFFFLEMNTRLQVEHPVTEALLGVDLVEWQFRVAAGEPLPLTPGRADAARRGHRGARQRRGPARPASCPRRGCCAALRLDGLGVRVDSGFEEGDEVSPHYDSLIAKLIAHADTREEAIAKLDAALARAVVMGPKTNIAFLRGAAGRAGVRRRRGTTPASSTPIWSASAPRRSRPTRAAALAGVRAILRRHRSRRRRRRQTAIPGRSPIPSS